MAQLITIDPDLVNYGLMKICTKSMEKRFSDEERIHLDTSLLRELILFPGGDILKVTDGRIKLHRHYPAGGKLYFTNLQMIVVGTICFGYQFPQTGSLNSKITCNTIQWIFAVDEPVKITILKKVKLSRPKPKDVVFLPKTDK
ncbi:hypothetical protein GF325_17005 [Candidatus Bathyarchaeota archaeon]|nr:hypothetical protein [Candidatus Bathyarchaeota archaeon]